MAAYYNERDPFKAEVIREAIKAGAIAPGDVDERSIADVQPSDLVGYAQCHFFAGGGFWSLALRQAGWGDDREVWTGSCPCPSFSAAGKGAGFADPRHLWPHWARLIGERKPSTIFGEQVSAAIGYGWLDLVSTDLEAEGYAVAAAVLGAHSVGAPHIRQRLFFVAESERERARRPVANETRQAGAVSGESGRLASAVRSNGETGLLGDAAQRGFGIAGSTSGSGGHTDGADEFGWLGGPSQPRLEGHAGDGRDGSEPGRQRKDKAGPTAETGGVGGLADTDGRDSKDRRIQRSRQQRFEPQDGGAGIVGIPEGERRQSGSVRNGSGSEGDGSTECRSESGAGCFSGCDHALGAGLQERFGDGGVSQGAVGEHTGQASERPSRSGSGAYAGGKRPSQLGGRRNEHARSSEDSFGVLREWRGPGWLDPQQARSVAEAGATRGWWADCDWWYGRDGKWRPAGPGIQPLAHGSPARVGRLRLYGDAICVPAARAFIEAYLETVHSSQISVVSTNTGLVTANYELRTANYELRTED